MVLGHVYIVLEPVGSARLTLDDDRYYKFTCFDVPKVFRSPGFDHGHDKESRNGRDIKIYILEVYIRTPEVFRMISEKTGVPEGLPEPPGRVLGLMGLRGKERGAASMGRAPPPPSGPNWTRRGAAPPSFLPLLSPFLPLLLMEGVESYSPWE